MADIKATEPPAKFLDPSFAGDFAAAYHGVTMTPGVGQFPTVNIPRTALHDVLALRAKYDGVDTLQDLDLLTTGAGGLYQPRFAQDA